MKIKSPWRIRLSQFLLGAVIFTAMVVARGTSAANNHVHMTTDWSHRHVVFSTPKSLIRRFQLSSDPRYVQQWIRRNAEKQGGGNEWRWGRAPEKPKHINGDWSVDMGSGAMVSPGMYPAKYSFDVTSANCASASAPDFVVYPTSLPGAAGPSGQATIAAFDNIYSSCSTSVVPEANTYWAYNTSTTAAALTSPVLSGDGSQVAFIQTTGPTTSGTSSLVLLRWAANSGTLSSPVAPTAVAAGSYKGCAAPCMTTLAFSTATGGGSTFDNRSSPFYDYPSDTLYVGDQGGFVHKFIGVFNGTPTEVVSTTGTTIWPANVSGGAPLTSAIFDDDSNQIFVCDGFGVLYRFSATTGSGTVPVFSAKIAGPGFDDSPLLDLATDTIYVFARGDQNGSQEAGVFQFTTGFGFNNAGTEAIVSNGNVIPSTAFYAGQFDNAYYNSANSTGSLYVCGTNGGDNAIWQIPINAGVMGTPIPGPALSTANVACSPITEFFNSNMTSGPDPSGTDLLIVSVAGSARATSPISCPSNSTGCVMSFDVTNVTAAQPISGSTPTSATTSVTNGTSGIVVDNASTTGGASQVYFTPLGNQACTTSGGTGGCAIQASQSGLN